MSMVLISFFLVLGAWCLVFGVLSDVGPFRDVSFLVLFLSVQYLEDKILRP